MTVTCIADLDKQMIVALYKTKEVTQRGLARRFGTSERTINRVLIEAGLATPVERIQGEAKLVMKLLGKHQVGYSGLRDLLEQQHSLFTATPVEDSLTLETVQAFLNKCTTSELASLFYHSGLVKIAEIHNTSVMKATQNLQNKAEALNESKT